LDKVHEQPTTVSGWRDQATRKRRMRRAAEKVNLPRETLDE
jgi:hypothetical protein